MNLRKLQGKAQETGQAAMAFVLGLTVLLATGGGLLAANAIQHAPLVQDDVISHYAYRALEAGINSYLNAINAQPNLVNCNSQSTSGLCQDTANGVTYDTWSEVADTDSAAGAVPEYYLWTNPQLCFSTSATTLTQCTSTGTGTLEHVQVLVAGAAGYPGHYAYQSAEVNFSPENGFLTHLWWSNYEVEDPDLTGNPTCTYDYDNSYNGPGNGCNEVFFGPTDNLFGPVFSNDSIYVASDPDFGSASDPSTVTTADPNCLFVAPGTSGDGSPPGCANASSQVGEYDATDSKYDASPEQIPTSDSELQTVAAYDGCVYQGPTTISFYSEGATGYMNVSSPETGSSGSDPDNDSTNTNTCLGTKIAVPTGSDGDGVIYVENSPTSSNCSGNGDNPFDDTADSGANAQISATYGYNYTDDIATVNDDCEGDAFVRDTDTANTPTGAVAGVTGNLTIAAANNVIITGNLTYPSTASNCGTSFNSTNTGPCAYQTASGTVNDSLGLIAQNFVEVNHPGVPNCSTRQQGGHQVTTCQSTPNQIEPSCSSSVSDLAAALCDPSSGASGGLTIDAAILALGHSFAVNNYNVGSSEGRLTIYGTIDQDWRGPVGTFSGNAVVSGYSKYYTWDSRLQYVSVPYYLTPGTPSWALASTAVVTATTCPAWPDPYPNGSTTTAGQSPSGSSC